MGALLAIGLLAQVQVRDEPEDWKLITSPNFNLYYPSDDLEARARQFAGWFEDAHAELIRKTGRRPRRVNVFLYRSFHDLMQASFLGQLGPPTVLPGSRLPVRTLSDTERPRFCRPNPRSRALALAEPLRDRIFIHCQPSDRWNVWFVKHELAHHIQFEHLYPLRVPGWLISLKDPLLPSWFMEGGADYYAGIFDSAKDQYMRDLAEEGLYTLKEIFFPDILNPYDFLAPYHQGSYFWRFLDERYGPGTARKLFEAEDEGLPLSMSLPVRHATGRPPDQVEREFAEHLQARWAPMLEGRGAPRERLTDTRRYYRRRAWGGRWSPDGNRLAWVGDEDVWPELYVDGKGMLGLRRGLDVGRVVSPPSWSPDSKRLVVVEEYMHRDILLIVDVDGGTETIRLDFDEMYDPAWSPEGNRIAFSALKRGVSDLYVLHLTTGRLEPLTDDPDADLQPAWGPDGRLAWVKETGGRTVLHVQGRGAVTRSWALLEYPQWSPDGKRIVAAADAGGIYDAFAINPDTGAAQRLTKFRGGVSYPSYHPDGSIVITYFEGRGQDLYRVVPEPQDEPGFDEEDRRPWYEPFRPSAPQGESAPKSRVWGVDWLMFPVLSNSLLAPGLEFQAGDRDGENQLSLFASGVAGDQWFAGMTVANTRWQPTIGAMIYGGRSDDFLETAARPFVEVPFHTSLTTSVGWTGRYREEWDDDNDFAGDAFDSGPVAAFRFSNQSGYHSWDPAWGVSFGGSGAFFSPGLGGDRERREYSAFFETSTDIVQDLIVWFRVDYDKMVGQSFLDEEEFKLRRSVRGAEDLKGVERGILTLELRFPLLRDMLFQPLEFLGMGNYLIFKDLRGFAFGQLGYAGLEPRDAWDDDFGAASAGLGLRLDYSFLLWPLVNARVPTRLEVWWAIVGQDEDDPRGSLGASVQFGF